MREELNTLISKFIQDYHIQSEMGCSC